MIYFILLPRRGAPCITSLRVDDHMLFDIRLRKQSILDASQVLGPYILRPRSQIDTGGGQAVPPFQGTVPKYLLTMPLVWEETLVPVETSIRQGFLISVSRICKNQLSVDEWRYCLDLVRESAFGS